MLHRCGHTWPPDPVISICVGFQAGEFIGKFHFQLNRPQWDGLAMAPSLGCTQNPLGEELGTSTPGHTPDPAREMLDFVF